MSRIHEDVKDIHPFTQQVISAKMSRMLTHLSIRLTALQAAELKKGQLDLTSGPAKAQEFVLKVYDAAVASDSLPKLLDASLYLESLYQFYGAARPVELTNRASYAQLRAEYLASCQQHGKSPAAAKPPALPVPTLPGASTAMPKTAAAPPAAPAPAAPATAPAAAPPAAPAPLAPAAPAAPAAPTAKAKAMPQTIAPEIAGMPRAKRQAEARKKTDQAPHHCFRLALLKQPCGDGSKPLCI